MLEGESRGGNCKRLTSKLPEAQEKLEAYIPSSSWFKQGLEEGVQPSTFQGVTQGTFWASENTQGSAAFSTHRTQQKRPAT